MRLAVATIVLLFLSSCHGDPFHGEYLREEPAAADLVGTYVHGLSAARLVVNADGSFSLSDVPACWRTGDSCDSTTTMSRTGTWKVEQIYDWWGVHFTSREPGPVYYSWGTSAMLRGEHPSYLIHFIVGDPDMGEALVFRRVSAPDLSPPR